MKAKDIKTIDINCKEWFDKVNGNSYFAGEVIVNSGKKNETTVLIPFQYGYGDLYQCVAFTTVKKELNTFKSIGTIRQAREKYKIKFNSSKRENCLKRELIEIGGKKN